MMIANPRAEAVAVIDGERWFVCPVRGPNCWRCAERLVGTEIARQVTAYHVELFHRVTPNR